MLGIRQLNGVQIDLFQGDITSFVCDAMGNAANPELAGGGGVDGAIHGAAGPELMVACRELGGCSTGSAKATPAFNLPCDFVFHAVGPVWQGGTAGEPAALRSAWRHCLDLAAQHRCRHLAMPSLSTGAYGYPMERAAGVAIETLQAFAAQRSASDDFMPQRITIVAFDGDTHAAYQTALFALMPEDDE